MTREELLKVAKPILFNTDMVRAILDGRKKVTRRIMKPQPLFYTGRRYIFADDVCPKKWEDCDNIIDTYQYQRGDFLYVRETWGEWTDGYIYKAWNEPFPQAGCYPETKWCPSIHMPKEAARIFLKVTDVMVKRLQDITEDGTHKEGIHFSECPDGFTWKKCTDIHNCYTTSMGAMQALWNSTIKKSALAHYGWEANPWVWVIEFERYIEENKLFGNM